MLPSSGRSRAALPAPQPQANGRGAAGTSQASPSASGSTPRSPSSSAAASGEPAPEDATAEAAPAGLEGAAPQSGGGKAGALAVREGAAAPLQGSAAAGSSAAAAAAGLLPGTSALLAPLGLEAVEGTLETILEQVGRGFAPWLCPDTGRTRAPHRAGSRLQDPTRAFGRGRGVSCGPASCGMAVATASRVFDTRPCARVALQLGGAMCALHEGEVFGSQRCTQDSRGHCIKPRVKRVMLMCTVMCHHAFHLPCWKVRPRPQREGQLASSSTDLSSS